MSNNKNNREFSKTLLVHESIMIWVISIGFLILAGLSIVMGYMGSLPWLAAMAACPWTAYGVSQACYYKKSEKENTTGGIKYETVLKEMEQTYRVYQETVSAQPINEAPQTSETAIDLDYGI